MPTPAPDAPLDQWLSYLETLHPTAIDMGLARISEVAKRLNITLPCVRITVGGTNGKGSTCALLEAIYLAAGYKVGTYSSPHLLRYNERIRLNGEQAGDAEIVEQFVRIDQARGDITLSYFEFSTLAAFLLFEARHVDVAILEVGLGGRLDAVNIIDADCAIVTSVDLDHQEYLGNDRERAVPRSAETPFRPSVWSTMPAASVPTSGCSGEISIIPATVCNGPMAGASSGAAVWLTRPCAGPISC
jgi:dihydrofolate synthase/folylpolyglutamate synthase